MLLVIVEFIYNNAKNVSIDYILFEFYCKYNLYVCFEDKIDSQSKFHLYNQQITELKK